MPLPSGIFIFLAVFLVASLFTFFVLRDYLFKGSSIGKRIFKLAVVDARTFSEPSGKQLTVKGLFSLFLIPVDALFLIFSSRSLGERATDTRVMPLQLIPDEKTINPFNEKPRSSTQKRIVVGVITALCIAVPLWFATSLSLESVTKQENYKVAYSYLINSDAFDKMQANESDIHFTGYSSYAKLGITGSEANTAQFTFLVKGLQFKVVCHPDGQSWYVCEHCTLFR